MTKPTPVLVSWSSGKDSAWALHTLRQQPERYEVRGIFTTVTPTFDRVSIQATPRAVLRLQAERLGLPLYEIPIPYPCSNQQYEAAMHEFLERIRSLDEDRSARHLAFGDLFLADIRQYREQNLRGTGFQPLFPLFGADTATLAQTMIAAGLQAIVTVVNPQQISPQFAGRPFDPQLLDDLPASADPLGENGEYHTCVIDGPMFSRPIAATAGEIVEREIRAAANEQDRYGNPTYVYADIVLQETRHPDETGGSFLP